MNVVAMRRKKQRSALQPVGSLVITVHEGTVTMDSHGLTEAEAYVLLCEAIGLVQPRHPPCPA